MRERGLGICDCLSSDLSSKFYGAKGSRSPAGVLALMALAAKVMQPYIFWSIDWAAS
jgi:hypothetical protein